MRFSTLAVMASAGLAASATAQTVVNVSGATLLQNFLTAPASTNDYLDIDGDGIARIFSTNDQLAPFTHPNFGAPIAGADQRWLVVQYRSVGSVNGFQELVDFGTTFVTTNSTGQIPAITASGAWHNRTRYITNGVSSNAIFNADNPGGAPVRSDQTTLFATPNSGGIRIDAAPVDVPSVWAVRNTAAEGAFDMVPGESGYGTNPRRSTNTAGTTANSNFDNLLANLGPRNLYSPGVTPDSNTIFDTSIAFAPIAAITNLGTGLRQIKQSDLRHAFATGRLVTGENLVVSTRDSGSGTRNGFNNSVGLDPSWGVGDNVGGVQGVGGSVLVDEHKLGPDFVPANKVGSGDIEATVINHRLAIGYTGAERGTTGSSAWLTPGRLEVLAVQADLSGGTQYARPTISNILDNTPSQNPSAYVIGGPAIFASIGDPRNQSEIGGDSGNANPRMPNPMAAAYLNNITRSVSAFVSVPGGSTSLFTPGEFLATTTLLIAATDAVQDKLNPTQMAANPDLNQPLQDYLRANHALASPAYATFGTVTLNGKVPTRKVGVVYSDGVAGGANYVNQAGVMVVYGDNLPSRNRIAGDFNGDGLRNLADATEMLRAYRSRNGGPAWVPPTGTIPGAVATDAVIEILGDFNGDGSFTASDVRYWADGLAIDPATGMLDRKKGFEAIDNAWQALAGSSNFFGTTLAGGGTYQAGFSAADVTGSGGVARGWAPVGANGVIDAADAAYITDQFTNNPFVVDGAANWSSIAEAVGFDLSGDVTGDLIVDQQDVSAVNAMIGGVTPCYANCDGSTAAPILNVADFTCFLQRFAAGDSYANCDGSTAAPTLNVADFTCFLQRFGAGCH